MKTILVFGGSGRIGSEVCRVMRNDNHVVYSADIQDLPTTQHRDEYIRCDVRNANSIVAAMETVYDKWQDIDVIINCAYPVTTRFGKNWPFPYSEDIYSFLTQNLISSYNILQEGYIRNCRNMVFISSIYGEKVPEFWIYDGTEIPHSPPEYAMSKAALNQMVRYYSKVFRDLKINAVAPGGIKSDKMDPQFIENYEGIAPFTTVREVADTVKWVTEQKAVRGQIITCDHGWS